MSKLTEFIKKNCFIVFLAVIVIILIIFNMSQQKENLTEKKLGEECTTNSECKLLTNYEGKQHKGNCFNNGLNLNTSKNICVFTSYGSKCNKDTDCNSQYCRNNECQYEPLDSMCIKENV